MSLKGTAPCGHPGTYVTANFIACDRRCEFAGPQIAVSPTRREPGHVDMCACAPCQIRRRATKIELVSADGWTSHIPWDGVTNKISWTPPRNATIRHWSFIEDDGTEVARGTIDVQVLGGAPANINIELFMDAASKAFLTIDQSRATKFKKFDPSKVIFTFKGVEIKGYATATPGHYVAEVPAELVKTMTEPVSVGYGVPAAPWIRKTSDEIFHDMHNAFAKHFSEPFIEKPDTLLVSGSFYETMLRACADRQAELYDLAETAFWSMPQG